MLQNSLCSCLCLVLIKLGETEEIKVDKVLDKIFSVCLKSESPCFCVHPCKWIYVKALYKAIQRKDFNSLLSRNHVFQIREYL